MSSAHDGSTPSRPPQIFAGLTVAGAVLAGAPRLGELVRERGGTLLQVSVRRPLQNPLSVLLRWMR